MASGLLIKIILFTHVVDPLTRTRFPIGHTPYPFIKRPDIQLSRVQQFRPPLDLRIQIFPVSRTFQQPCLMIDTGDLVLYRIIVSHIQFIEQCRSTDLDRVAKPDRLHLSVTQHSAGEHCHRIGIIEEPCIRAHLFHIPCKIHHHRNRTQRAENTADAQRIRDGLLQPIFLWNFKISNGTWIITTDLNGIDNIIRASQCIFTVLHTQIFFDTGFGTVGPVDSLQHRSGLIQPY